MTVTACGALPLRWYERHEGSGLFPDLALAQLARYVDAENQTDAVRRYRDALRHDAPGRAYSRPRLSRQIAPGWPPLTRHRPALS